MCIIDCGPTCECILTFLFLFFNWLNAKKWGTCQEDLTAETENKKWTKGDKKSTLKISSSPEKRKRTKLKWFFFKCNNSLTLKTCHSGAHWVYTAQKRTNTVYHGYTLIIWLRWVHFTPICVEMKVNRFYINKNYCHRVIVIVFVRQHFKSID